MIFFPGKIHSQLRRLHNEGASLKNANITSVPAYQSKVSFKCIRTPDNHSCTDSFDKNQVK